MVTIRKRVAGKSLPGRLRRTDALAGIETGKVSLVLLKSARRSDQRSAFTIPGSARSSSRSTVNKREETGPPPRVTSATATTTEPTNEAVPTAVRHLKGGRRIPRAALRCRNSGSGKSGLSSWVNPKLLHANSGTSNSIGLEEAETMGSVIVEVLPAAVGSHQQQLGGSHRSLGSTRQAKTVSISASQEGRTGSCIQLFNSHSDLSAKRSIIKLKPLPLGVPTDAHNELAATPTPRENPKSDTLHAQREQKIFRECRFIPSDTFYKKVIVAPNQDRRFFAAPRCTRVPGSRMFYDILGENKSHHRDVNTDFTRDMVKRMCSNYCKPSQFRHMW